MKEKSERGSGDVGDNKGKYMAREPRCMFPFGPAT